MNKKERIEALLQEKRISYNDDTKNSEGNRVGGIYELIQDFFEPHFVVVEIGSCEGTSTELFALTCGYVYAIDPWDTSRAPNADIELEMAPASEAKCRERLAKYDNVTIIKGFAEERVEDFKDESLDAVYIDGAHDQKSVIQDIDLWLPKIKDGGVMCGHDWKCPYVSRAVKRKFGPIWQDYKDGSWAVNILKISDDEENI